MTNISIILIAFLSSILSTFLVILLARRYKIGLDGNKGVQKNHIGSPPRLGGLAFFLALIISILVTKKNYSTTEFNFYFLYFLAIMPAFLGGLVEDFTGKVSALVRFILTLTSAALAYYLVDAKIKSLGLDNVDLLLKYDFIGLIVTTLALAGVANGSNMLDGFNGLLLGFSVVVLVGLCFLSWLLDDNFMFVINLALLGSSLGVFVFNFPFGKIFNGDGGSYSIGLFLATSVVLIYSRNFEKISPVAIGIFLSYPTLETIFSIARRGFKNMFEADGKHLHQLLFYRLNQKISSKNPILNNSLVTVILLPLYAFPVVAGIIFLSNGIYSILSFFVFAFIYLSIYSYLKRTKAYAAK